MVKNDKSLGDDVLGKLPVAIHSSDERIATQGTMP